MLRYSRSASVVEAEIGDTLVALEPVSGQFHEFNEVAARVWQLLEQPRSVDDLVTILVSEYEVAPQRCRQAVIDFLGQAQRDGLVQESA